MIGMLRRMTILDWQGDLPEFGDVLFTAAGSRYVVHSIRRTRPISGKAPKSIAKCELVKLAAGDAEPVGARRHQFAWCSRGPRT